MAATLREISQRLKLSESTVSLVLNGKQFHRVAPKTRERIERAAREMDYAPSRSAQSLARGKTMAIGVIVNDLSNPFFGGYASLIERRLAEFGYHTVPAEKRGSLETEARILRWLPQRYLDGMIKLEYSDFGPLGEVYERLSGDLPVVVRAVDDDGGGPRECPFPSVAVDYSVGTLQLFTHLRQTGRQRLSMLLHRGQKPGEAGGKSRHAEAIAAQLKTAGLSVPASRWFEEEEDAPLMRWYDLARRVLAQQPDTDALFVHNAAVVAPVLQAVADAGRRIGGDVAVATYDDPPSLQWMRPGVTVVREPMERVAEDLVDMLLARLLGRQRQSFSQTVPTELVIRGSTVA